MLSQLSSRRAIVFVKEKSGEERREKRQNEDQRE